MVKLLYTAFMAILVPKYWIDYGPTNFLYFCDVALFMTLAALWLENSLLASAPLVGILVPQIVWMVDFLAGVFGYTVTGMTAYMFDPGIPLFTRGLSFFHFWLPLFLIWLVWRLGYDRRAFVVWSALAIVVLLICYFVMPAPPAPTDNKNLPVNINYVHGLSDETAQTWMPPLAWLASLIAGLPLFAYLPTHFLLKWLFPAPKASG
ncbi:MAG: hypothetical protein L0Y72_20170 [Gemmataceae bacterium]|nr:hypothetical protein [Gemmataceae bacterium]MCI0741354.1 hypothetical protein [Gemmataceae bacterium]